jgi:protein-disulfide isomerase
MPPPFSAVPHGVKPLLLTALTLVLGAPAFAADFDPKIDRAIREALPVCNGAKVTYGELPVKLPPRFTGKSVIVGSANHDDANHDHSNHNHGCEGQYAAVVSPAGNLFLGAPWPIAGEEGKTPMEKLQAFAWRNMRENVTVTVDPKRTVDGLFRTTMHQQTENGKMPLEGVMDENGSIFFFGSFRPASDMRAMRAKAFEPFVAGSPAKGAANAKVTVVEFSDFQCPSCKHAANFLDPILAKHGDSVRYVRYDLPLSGHAWAFPAALAGRAIYRQKPELFWEFKKQVYTNQAGMNTFMFWDWARGFAEDNGLDLAKYDADLGSQEIKDQILKGTGTAFVNDIRATPSYMVNGALVEAGDDGKALAAYVDSLLAK